MPCLKCFFHVNIQIDKLVNVMFAEKVSMWNMTSENISKNSTWLFWVPSWRYQYIWQLLQNQKVLIMASYSNNHYWSYTFLNPWALSYNRVVIFDFWQKPKIFFKILHCQPKFKIFGNKQTPKRFCKQIFIKKKLPCLSEKANP